MLSGEERLRGGEEGALLLKTNKMKLPRSRSTQRTIQLRGSFPGTKGHKTARLLRDHIKDGQANSVTEKMEREMQMWFP